MPGSNRYYIGMVLYCGTVCGSNRYYIGRIVHGRHKLLFYRVRSRLDSYLSGTFVEWYSFSLCLQKSIVARSVLLSTMVPYPTRNFTLSSFYVHPISILNTYQDDLVWIVDSFVSPCTYKANAFCCRIFWHFWSILVWCQNRATFLDLYKLLIFFDQQATPFQHRLCIYTNSHRHQVEERDAGQISLSSSSLPLWLFPSALFSFHILVRCWNKLIPRFLSWAEFDDWDADGHLPFPTM